MILRGRAAALEGNFEEALTFFRKAVSAISDTENDSSGFLFEWIQGHFFIAKTLVQTARKSEASSGGVTSDIAWKAVLSASEKAISGIEKLGGDFNDPESEIDLRARFQRSLTML